MWVSCRTSRTAHGRGSIEAEKRDPNKQLDWVALVDGNEDQLALLEAYQRLIGTKLTIIIDFIHVSDYLWKAAIALHEGSSREAENGIGSGRDASCKEKRTAWQVGCAKARPSVVCPSRHEFRSTRAQPICSRTSNTFGTTSISQPAIRSRRRHRGLVPTSRQGPNGHPRSLGIETAEAVLKLRALRSSGDFDEYRAYHERREFERNHLARYESLPLRSCCSTRPERAYERSTEVSILVGQIEPHPLMLGICFS